MLLWPRAFPRKHELTAVPFSPVRTGKRPAKLPNNGRAATVISPSRQGPAPVHLSQTMGEKPTNTTRKAVPIAVAVLAGGLSSRMGQDKSRLRLGRRTLLGHIRATAEQLGLPVRVIRRDIVPRCGPLGGVFTALATSRAGAELFLSCDMPFVSVALLRRLLSLSRSGERAVFATGPVEVSFPFIIPVRAVPTVQRQIAARRLPLQSLALVLHARRVRAGAAELLNINTPADLQMARRSLL